jgi:hypothetical protein
MHCFFFLIKFELIIFDLFDNPGQDEYFEVMWYLVYVGRALLR